MQADFCHNLDPRQKTFSYTVYIDVSFCTESFKKVVGLSFLKLSFEVVSAYMLL